MIPLNINMDSSMGVTVLSNTFIDNYLKDANDAQIKVYLHLLRMVGSGLPTDLNEIADRFNLTEKDAIKSIKHWESVGLIELTYNEAKEIVGIKFKETAKPAEKRTSPVTISTGSSSGSISRIKMDYQSEKEKYSSEDIMKLSSNPEITMLLNVAEQYFSRPLNPPEIKTILFIYDRLAFSSELLDYLLEYCSDNNHKNIHYMEQVAINWYEEGVDTIGKAKQSTKKSDKNVTQIMGYLGIHKNPAPCELKLIHKWIHDYGFSMTIIEEACSRAVLNSSVEKNPVPYADAILSKWFNLSVRTREDIIKLDKEHDDRRQIYEENRKNYNDNKKTSADNNKFNQIEKNDYDFDELEKAALYHIN